MSKVYILLSLILIGCSSNSGPQSPPSTGGLDAGSHSGMDAATPPQPSVDAGSPGIDTGAVCIANSMVCTSTPNACCSGFCISSASDPSEPAICSAACTTGSECESGCCAPINSTQSVCSGIGFCSNTCKAPGDSCTLPEDCCTNNGVPQQCVAVAGGAFTCAAECTSNADCFSGCCAPLSNLSISVCEAAQFCH